MTKIEELATTLYENPATDAAFERAWEMFPEYNDGGEDTDKALEYILEDILGRIPEDLSEQERDGLTEELSDMIHAGLT